MQEQKKYHTRKLAIIEMIEECDRCIVNANRYLNLLVYQKSVVKNALDNLRRYERIKTYLTERYNRN